jgi:hypothetical protein
MPQLQLPIFPTGLTLINNLIGFEKKEGRVYYLGLGWVSFHIGGMPRQSWHSAVCQKSACAYDSEGYF